MKDWVGGAGSHSGRYHSEEGTKLWLNSGCRRAGAVLSGWGRVHPLLLTLGKQREKNHSKSAVGLEADTLPTCVCGPGGATDGALCACASPSPAPFSLLCRAARHGKERQKNAQTKITQGFICKANGAGGSGFPQAAKKGCIESPGWAEHRRHSSLSSSVALLQTQMGSGSSTTGQREKRESVLGAVQRAAHAARTGPVLDRFVWGLQTSGPISGQTIPFPHHCPKIFWCLIMGCACYGAFYYWWYLFNLFSIFTKHLLFQPQLGLASKFNSYEEKGQVSCMGTIS